MKDSIYLERVAWFARLAFGYYGDQDIPPMPKKSASQRFSVMP